MSNPLARYQSKQQPQKLNVEQTLEQASGGYVTRPDGQRVKVKAMTFHQPGEKPAPRRARQLEFSKMPLDWAADMLKAIDDCGAMVVIVMRYLSWKAKSPTFVFSNTLLTRYGIDRYCKYRVLEKLEAAGKIKVEHRGSGKAPIVMFLTPLAL